MYTHEKTAIYYTVTIRIYSQILTLQLKLPYYGDVDQSYLDVIDIF